jgi:hypothetical protein
METTRVGGIETSRSTASPTAGSSVSGVSWSAVFAGAVGAAALSLILILLGLAFGFAVASPWAGAGASAETIGAGAIVWLAVTHVAAAALGGYLAGRLRVKWTDIHDDEIYFRDTAHGFLAWSLATLVTAALVGAAASGMVAAEDRTDERPMPGGAAALTMNGTPALLEPWTLEYYADTLFRAEGDAAEPPDAQAREQAVRVLEYSLVFDRLADEDRRHLGSLVSRYTGLAPEQAEQRVEEVYASATGTRDDVRGALDELRSAAAWTSGWIFVTLLMGAFFASLAATYGGRHRDTRTDLGPTPS